MPDSNYGNVLSGGNGDLYSDLFRAAILDAMNREGSGSGGTPNFYPIPLTPEQKRVEDEKWRVYQAGGSPTQQAAQGIARQALSQSQSTAPGFQFMSPELKGQAFAGGVKLPTFDFSKLATGPAHTTTPPNAGLGLGPLHSNPTGSPSGAIAFKTPYDTGYDAGLDRTHYGDSTGDTSTRPGMDSLDFGSDNPNGPSPLRRAGQGVDPGSSTLYEKASGWFADFQKQHPNWAQLGPKFLETALAAAFGLPGAVVGRVARWLITRGSGATTPPNGSGGPPTPVGPTL